MLVRAFFLLLFFLRGFCHVSFEICTVGPSFFPTCAYISAERMLEKVCGDMNASSLT
jgi:hypothetical protein